MIPDLLEISDLEARRQELVEEYPSLATQADSDEAGAAARVNLDEERAKLASLLDKREELRARTELEIAACRAAGA